MTVREDGGPVVEERLEVPGSFVEQLDFVKCPAETRGVVVVPLDGLPIRIERTMLLRLPGEVSTGSGTVECVLVIARGDERRRWSGDQRGATTS